MGPYRAPRGRIGCLAQSICTGRPDNPRLVDRAVGNLPRIAAPALFLLLPMINYCQVRVTRSEI
eukprot:9411753-Lingulodinium_polyedra.AAC.1